MGSRWIIEPWTEWGPMNAEIIDTAGRIRLRMRVVRAGKRGSSPYCRSRASVDLERHYTGAMDGNHLLRREQTFQGHVQGVGFRYTTMRISGRYAVTGYVQNMTDGSVSLVAEGEESSVNGFLREVADRLAAYIRDTEDKATDFQGEFDDFCIRH